MIASRNTVFWLLECSIACLFLGICAWKNAYPLLYADTGTYLKSGFIDFAFPDRPIGYGIFLRHTSLAESLWFALVAQLLVVAAAIRLWLKVFFPGKLSSLLFVTICLLLSLLSNVSPTATLMIPDVFFGVVLLCLMVLFSKDSSKAEKGIAATLGAIFLPMHTALPPVLFLFLAGAGLLFLVSGDFKTQRWALIATAGMLVFGVLTTSITNKIYRDEFVYSAGSHAFIINKFRDAGILKDYLAANCGQKNHELCTYQADLEGDFLWDYEHSPFHKMGGWESTRSEYNAIIRDIITTPKYLVQLTADAAIATAYQLVAIKQEEALSQVKGGPDYAISDYLPRDKSAFLAANQQDGGLALTFYNTCNAMALIGFAILLILSWLPRTSPKLFLSKREVVLPSLFLLCNAVVSAMLSGVVDRYSTRLLWVLSLMVIVQVTTLVLRSRWWMAFSGNQETMAAQRALKH